jgi:hypothetical protein
MAGLGLFVVDVFLYGSTSKRWMLGNNDVLLAASVENLPCPQVTSLTGLIWFLYTLQKVAK